MHDPTTAPDSPAESATTTEPTAVPLLAPRDGVPDVVATPEAVRRAAAALAGGTGPLSVDAERASGFRYSARAYLIQLRREGAGTVLLDPIPVAGQLAPLAEAINPLEWVLHSADQDLPGLAEVGLRPSVLFDTELAGRLAGFERVGLAAIVERTLGFELRKGHGAADWSKRPLPEAWLNYAALDVELLVELRAAMVDELRAQDKLEWAREEFEHIRLAGPPKPKPDRWRRTSHVTTLKSTRQLAAVRALWQAREDIARKRDISPSRILPDSAIIDAAGKDPRSIEALRALPVFGGPRQRRYSRVWLGALESARTLDESELPPRTPPITGPPQASRWARTDPEAAERLTAARAALADLSEAVAVPVENLVSPELVRRLCWDWDPGSEDAAAVVDQVLAAGGARGWQRTLAGPVLAKVLADH
ncbi:ribonuclease D [Rhodococcus triatomae]|uniref:Ribonuclease D n=1 Tax=Rhodococcus triatomae TaxID=300028 RepID=A0A1G8KPK5_9NOCA|nr:ribonuclease D [Rhodococcus triatomae]QNG18986.1 ribonuclease D [Rhodococcus triatomae]QNG25101.1 ribonuclease D [Rhodococcus triatomae]SDI45282.1 ribonuclease D [Rhodococcus triatomae]